MATDKTQEDERLEDEHSELVEIFKTNSIGIGAYGAVYKARYGELPCAAKVIHPILFQDGDPDGHMIISRFQQECTFLRQIKHPNIVQFLGVVTDKDSGAPVLLMELLDESLTSFLEKSFNHLIPYHTQLDISQDIALAVAYLHSRGIVHRDLSSNNVLLMAGSRAKVTDFGMSRVENATGHVTRQSLTHLPGTQVFMPPEAFMEPPLYDKKIDCFSFGVLVVQIITRLFPEPGPRFITVPDARSPTGTSQIPVLEMDRRMNHISLIVSSHPLLPTIRQCLEYVPDSRPTGSQLCCQLAALKELNQYKESKEQLGGAVKCVTDTLKKDEEIAVLHQRIQEKDQLIEKRDRLCRNSEKEIEQLEEQVEMLKTAHQYLHGQEKQSSISSNSGQPMSVQHSEEPLQPVGDTNTPDMTYLKWTVEKAPCNMSRGFTTANQVNVFFGDGKDDNICMFDSVGDVWSVIPNCPLLGSSLVMFEGLLTSVGGYVSYFSGYETSNWLLSLVQFEGETKWMKMWPSMPTKRYRAAVVCYEQCLVVLGGAVAKNVSTNAVEIFDLSTRQWYVASSLPHPLQHASAVIYNDSLYLCGWIQDVASKPCTDVLTCALSDLQASKTTHRFSFERMRAALSREPPLSLWKRFASLPVGRSTFVVFNNELIAVGGRDSAGKPSSGIYHYNTINGYWTFLSRMPLSRSDCHVSVLPGNKLLIVGGCGESKHHQSLDIQLGVLE